MQHVGSFGVCFENYDDVMFCKVNFYGLFETWHNTIDTYQLVTHKTILTDPFDYYYHYYKLYQGKRHDPLAAAFMNGPVQGKDVFIPMTAIIGGQVGLQLVMWCF